MISIDQKRSFSLLARVVLVLALLVPTFAAAQATPGVEPIAPSPVIEPTTAVAPIAPAEPLSAPTVADAATPVAEAAPEAATAPEVDVALVPETQAPVEPEPERKPEWYELLKIRGYTQLRYNGFPTFDSNKDLVNAQGDRSIGGDAGFLIRRARVILYGDVHEQVAVYLQTDFASSIDSQTHIAIVRDWYADLFLTQNREFRLRVGQSKVPFGFENMQSSQNRLPFDRNDALNSALKDERDLGAFFYWAPEHIRTLFKSLVDDGLKGSGDYGALGLGIFNGQTANRFDNNGNFHVVGRFTWPFQIGDQVIEVGGGGYVGKYRVGLDTEDTPYATTSSTNDLLDRRVFGTFVLYPKPFGFVAEYNYGEGPAQGRANPELIDTRTLHGGYAQVMLKLDEPLGTIAMIPYVRAQYYRGGKKFETNAPRYEIDEIELGVEWQILKALEVVGAYMISDRTSSRAPYTQQQGHVARLQVQFNY